jgi:hypothetical protein
MTTKENVMFKFLKALWSEVADSIDRSNKSTGPSIEDSFDHSSDHSHSVNPATGMPMLPGGAIDVLGNPFGTDLNSDTFGSDSSIFDDHSIGISSNDMFDDHNSLFGDDHFSDFGGSSFDDPFS